MKQETKSQDAKPTEKKTTQDQNSSKRNDAQAKKGEPLPAKNQQERAPKQENL
ncbi:MAG: hypothetical protein QM790_03730 [Nibricoccus sp.]